MGPCLSSPDVFNEDEVDLSHFTILKRIGEGGFGAVNLVFHKGSETMMAMKRMKKCKVVARKCEIDTVWMERNLLSEFDCFSLPRLLFAFQDETEIFLLMTLMRGGDLLWYLQTHGPMKTKMTQYYGAEIIIGLEHLKHLKIVWRDLKPQNLLFDDEGHMKLTDFGLAVRLTAKRGFKTKGRAGTRGYMAPEVEAREKYDYGSDIYSLGVTLREMIDDVGAAKKGFKSLHAGLTEKDPDLRMGCGSTSYNEIKMHTFFKDMEWEKIAEGKHGKPPFKPDLSNINADASHALNEALVDLDLGGEDAAAAYEKILTDEDNAHFENFEYNEVPYERHITNIKKLASMSSKQAEEVQMKAWTSGRKTSFLGKFKDGTAKWATRSSLTMIMEERLKLGDKIVKMSIPEGNEGVADTPALIAQEE